MFGLFLLVELENNFIMLCYAIFQRLPTKPNSEVSFAHIS